MNSELSTLNTTDLVDSSDNSNDSVQVDDKSYSTHFGKGINASHHKLNVSGNKLKFCLQPTNENPLTTNEGYFVFSAGPKSYPDTSNPENSDLGVKLEDNLRFKTDEWSAHEIASLSDEYTKNEIQKILNDRIRFFEKWFSNTCVPVIYEIGTTSDVTLDLLSSLKESIESFLKIKMVKDTNLDHSDEDSICKINKNGSKMLINKQWEDDNSRYELMKKIYLEVLKEEEFDDKSRFELEQIFYSTDVLSRFNVKNNTNVSNKHLQIISCNFVRCLICKTNIHGPFELNVRSHVFGNNHKKNLSNEDNSGIIEKYHENWKIISNEFYFQQQFFFPFNTEEAQCILCYIGVNYTDLTKHFLLETHNYELHKVLRHVKSKRSLMKTLLPSKIEETKIMLNISKSVIKLSDDFEILNTEKNVNDSSHASIPSAQVNLKFSPTEYLTDNLMTKMKVNSRRPLSKTIQIIAENMYKCLICQIIAITDLETHIRSSEHIKTYVTARSQDILRRFHTEWEKINDWTVNHQIYFFPQTRQTQTCCLCSKVIQYHPNNVREHCFKHKNKAIYGPIWLFKLPFKKNVFDLVAEQTLTNFLTPRYINEILPKCYLRKLYYEELLNNIAVKENRNNLMKCDTILYNCILCQAGHIPTKSLEQHISSNIHQTRLKIRYYLDLVDDFHNKWDNLQPVELQLQQIYFLPSENGNLLKCLCCHDRNEIELNYLKQHLNNPEHIFGLLALKLNSQNKSETFQHKIEPISKEDSEVNTIQQIDIVSNKCLLCKHLISIPDLHLKKDLHQNYLSFATNIKILRQYYEKWDQISTNLKKYDIFFYPLNSSNVSCLHCQKSVLFDELSQHLEIIQSVIEKQMKVTEQSSEPKFTMAIFYPVSLLKRLQTLEGKVSRNVQMINGKLYRCLVCKIITNDLEDHIDRSLQHKELLSNQDLIKTVQRFHSIWADIDNHLKFHQKYFYPNDSNTIFCTLCNQVVSDTDLLEHLNLVKHIETKFLPDDVIQTSQSTSHNRLKYETNSLLNVELQNNLVLVSENNSEKTIESSLKKLSFTNNIKIIELDNSKSISEDDVRTLSRRSTKIREGLEISATDTQLQDEDDRSESSTDDSYVSFDDSDDSHDDKNLSNEKTTKEFDKDVQIIDKEKNTKLQKMWLSLSKRFRSNEKVIFWKNGLLLCSSCSVQLGPSKNNIMAHITQKSHYMKLYRTDKSVRWRFLKYDCYYCKMGVFEEHLWQEHLKSSKHSTYLNLTNHDDFCEDFCEKCQLVRFAEKKVLEKHEHVKRKRKNKAPKMPPKTLQQYLVSASKLDQLLKILVHNALKVTSNCELDQICLNELVLAMRPHFRNCNAYRFGSRASGLGSDDSDIDIFLDLGNMYDGNEKQDATTQAEFVQITYKILKNYPNTWTKFIPIPLARTPILRVTYRPSKLECDISFRHGLSVENTKLLSFYLNYQEKARKLILFIKFWASHYQLDYRLNSYALSMMAIFFLQTKKMLHSVAELRKMYTGPPKVIQGWDCTFFDDLSAIEHLPCNTFFPYLLYEFFNYFAEFQYNVNVVCPLLGRTVRKDDFHTITSNGSSLLPPEMRSYVEKLIASEDSEAFRSLSPLCVQDPFDLGHNLTKALPEHVVVKFKQSCEISRCILKNALNF